MPSIHSGDAWSNTGSEHYPMYSDGFSAEDKNALAHLKSVETFSFISFIIYSMVLYHVLTYFREPMRRLQGISQDLSSGLRMIKDCQKDSYHPQQHRRTDGIFRLSLRPQLSCCC